MRKFLVFLRPGSSIANVFVNDRDAESNGHPVFTCEEVDLSGPHFSLVKRIPVPKNRDGSDRSHQSIWIPNHDIALVFQYDGTTMPIGF